MTEATLCDAGETLFRQVNRHWPGRDHASDGWINDIPTSDHYPDPSTGIVHAIDIDASLGGPAGYNTTNEAWRLANQLRLAMIGGDKRISYIIAWDPSKDADFICSMNPAYAPLGRWRAYLGDSHVNHIHVSFTNQADHHGRRFDLPIFGQEDAVTKEEQKAIVQELLGTRIYGDEAPKADRDVTVRDVYRKLYREASK